MREHISTDMEEAMDFNVRIEECNSIVEEYSFCANSCTVPPTLSSRMGVNFTQFTERLKVNPALVTFKFQLIHRFVRRQNLTRIISIYQFFH